MTFWLMPVLALSTHFLLQRRFPHMRAISVSLMLILATLGCLAALWPTSQTGGEPPTLGIGLVEAASQDVFSFGVTRFLCVCVCGGFVQRLALPILRLQAVSFPGAGAVHLLHAGARAGVCARKVGPEFHLSHGRSGARLMPVRSRREW